MAAIRFIDRHEPAEGEVTALVHNIARAIRLPHADDDGLLTEHLAAFFVLNGRDPEGHFTNRDQMREYWKWNRERVLGAWTSSGCSGVPWAATALDDSFVVTPDDIEVLATHYYSEIGANNPASLKYAGAKLDSIRYIIGDHALRAILRPGSEKWLAEHDKRDDAECDE